MRNDSGSEEGHEGGGVQVPLQLLAEGLNTAFSEKPSSSASSMSFELAAATKLLNGEARGTSIGEAIEVESSVSISSRSSEQSAVCLLFLLSLLLFVVEGASVVRGSFLITGLVIQLRVHVEGLRNLGSMAIASV